MCINHDGAIMAKNYATLLNKYDPSCERKIQVCDSDHTDDGPAMVEIE
jgi:hypothetical protein